MSFLAGAIQVISLKLASGVTTLRVESPVDQAPGRDCREERVFPVSSGIPRVPHRYRQVFTRFSRKRCVSRSWRYISGRIFRDPARV